MDSYTESIDGGYCKYYALFAKCGPTVTELGVLVNKPLTNFKKATEKLDKHFFETQFHKLAVQAAMMFSKVQQNKTLSVDQQLNTLRQERIAQNRAKLRSIVETIIFCGRQGIALRGHRDYQTHVESNPISNHGNFWHCYSFVFWLVTKFWVIIWGQLLQMLCMSVKLYKTS